MTGQAHPQVHAGARPEATIGRLGAHAGVRGVWSCLLGLLLSQCVARPDLGQNGWRCPDGRCPAGQQCVDGVCVSGAGGGDTGRPEVLPGDTTAPDGAAASDTTDAPDATADAPDAPLSCRDLDGDGYRVGPPGFGCEPIDCDDAVATCATDCTTDADADGRRDCDDPCVDVDGDGYGQSSLPENGACLGLDCRDDLARCTAECTDGDGDGTPDCADDCLDADFDGFGAGPGCLGPDCDDASPGCAFDCAADADQDGQRDCADPCVDADGDSFGEGPECAGFDCDDAAAECHADCATDADGDGLPDCGDLCLDGDGDGHGSGPGCFLPDCDDGDWRCTLDCSSDRDGDGQYDCADPCLDTDGDGYGDGRGCLTSDCDDSRATCHADCSDRDHNGAADCADGCLDPDEDGFGAGPACACGRGDCTDCDPHVPSCTTDCARDGDGDGLPDCSDPCFDGDGDGWGSPNVAFGQFCDALAAAELALHPHCAFGCVGIDCDDAQPHCAADCTTDVDADGVVDCQDPCIDRDRDGHGAGTVFGNECAGPDCDDRFPTCTDDCAADLDADGTPDCQDGCIDGDRDNWGATRPELSAWCDALRDGGGVLPPACAFPCAGADCDDLGASCRADCTTDADHDSLRDCDDPCLDADGDGFGWGTGCSGRDCDDAAATCTEDCTTDVDADGRADCADGCIDFDCDGYGVGPGGGPACPDDCFDQSALCTVDCTDGDLDGRPDCADACLDADGDRFCANAGPAADCDDDSATCWGAEGPHACARDADGDGVSDCEDPCVDADGDGYGFSNLGGAAVCLGPDCNDSQATCADDCLSDADGDGVSDCEDPCVDRDGDGFGESGGPPPTCAGPDCRDDLALVHPGRPERCNGLDDDCNGLTDAADAGLGAGDPQPCEAQQGVCGGASKPAGLCENGVWLPCNDATYAAHSAFYEPRVESSCDGRDNDCNGSFAGDVDEDFTLVDWDWTVRRVGEPCGTGACAGGTAVCGSGVSLRCNSASLVAPERCDRVDNDCDGLTDAADAADLAASDVQPCELSEGVCAACTKPAGLCVGGVWQVCTLAIYAACRPLDYESRETLCGDGAGLDNDCDGRPNCADADCLGLPGPSGQLCETTAESSCFDGLDNDGDGLTDCADPQCADQPCDDAFGCTEDDVCAAGLCRGTPVDDGCDDANDCTVDTCEADVGCVFAPRAAGSECGSRYCDGLLWRLQTCQFGQCRGTAVVEDCADRNDCTIDACNPVTGCSWTDVPDGSECDARFCDGLVYAKHTCVAGACFLVETIENCGDDDVCTADACNAAMGGCSHADVPAVCAAAWCSDEAGVPTFHPERRCVDGQCPGDLPVACNDGNLCTDDTCNAATGCGHANNALECAPGACDGAGNLTYHARRLCSGGRCPADSPVNCNDGNLCTDDTCNAATGCGHANNALECAPGACDGAGNLTYHARRLCSGGRCPADSPVNCNDGNLCTDDTCNAATGCGHANNAVECAAAWCEGPGGLMFHPRRLCSGGSCPADSPLNCNDGTACTDDSCSATGGCSHANNTSECFPAYCLNETTYSEARYCSGGECGTESLVNCLDGNACTRDTCDNVSGCRHAESCCGDDISNDGDAFVDCNDYDCRNEPVAGCTPADIFPTLTPGRCEPNGETSCFDGCDNDRDGRIDCDDFHCSNRCCDTGRRCGSHGACTTDGVVVENKNLCLDGLDNDCDGCVDGADSGCGGAETDYFFGCQNGVDDDCDGLTDAEDTADCPSGVAGGRPASPDGLEQVGVGAPGAPTGPGPCRPFGVPAAARGGKRG